MIKTKRFIALFLVLVLATSMSLAGCGKNKASDTGSKDVTASVTKAPEADPEAIPADVIPKETVTLDVYSQLANYTGEQVGWFAKVMKDKFNVKLNIIKDEDGVMTTRMESGDLGDIVCFGSDSDQYIQAANNGMLFDWNQDDLLTDYGPYIKAHLKKALEKNASLTKSGKTYGFGFSVADSTAAHATYFYHPDIRWDLYKQLGYPKVNNLDDLIKVLGDMKKICPKDDAGKETYGVSMFTDWDGDMVMQVKATAALYGYDEFGLGLYDVNTQTWQGCLQDDGMYLKMLKWYNKLYRANLLDPDSMTQGFEGAGEDYQNGGAFWNLFSFLASAGYNTDKHIKEGKAMYTLPLGDQSTLSYGLSVFGANRLWTIGAATQYPELCMAIINWLATPEGFMIQHYGPKGLCWDYDKDGKTFLTELGLKANKDPKTEITGDGYSGTKQDGNCQIALDVWNLDANNPDSNGETYNCANWASYQATENSDILNDWRTFTGFTTPDEFLDSRKHTVSIGTNFSLEPRSDELDVTWQQVIKTIKDSSWKAIYAENDNQFNKIVKDMQDKANGYKYSDCVAFMQGQAAKRKAAEDACK